MNYNFNNMTNAQLEEKLQEYNENINTINKLLKKNQNTEAQNLAEALHDKQCTWSHTDRCAWYYEITDGVANWSNYQHAKYLAKAEKILASHNYADVIKFIDFIDLF